MRNDLRDRPESPGARAARERLAQFDKLRSRVESQEPTSRRFELGEESSVVGVPLTAAGTPESSSKQHTGSALLPGGFLAPSCVHQWKRSHGHAGDAGACERPSRICCTECGGWFPRRCETGSAAKCQHCSTLKAGDLAAIARSGFTDRPCDRASMLTLTAPGADVLPWDLSQCIHGPEVACSGKVGCVVDADALARWHATLPRRWSDFVTDLRRLLARPVGRGAVALPVDVQFMKVYELQSRGALHIHALVRLVGVCSQRRYKAAVRLLARRHGFGSQFDISAIEAASEGQVARSGRYVAKYVVKACDAIGSVRMVDGDGQVCSRSPRVWSASRRWGLTMKDCGLVRRQWACGGGGADVHAPAGAPHAAEGGLDSYWNHSAVGVASRLCAEESAVIAG